MIQPLIILAAIPFAVAGVIYTFFLWGMSISFAGIGLLGLIGIVVNDSLIMVSHLNNLSKDKELSLDIIIQGSTDRLRAVLLNNYNCCWNGSYYFWVWGERTLPHSSRPCRSWGFSLCDEHNVNSCPNPLLIQSKKKNLKPS